MSSDIHRRHFLGQSALGASILTMSAATTAAKDVPSEGSVSKQIQVGLITHAGGVHLDHYYRALKEAEEVGSVVLADPDGNAEAQARSILGRKLAQVYKGYGELLQQEEPAMVLISMEAKESPAVIDAALDAGCHVLAEKPACVHMADFEALVQKANSKNLHLMLALANRLNPEIQEAKRIVEAGNIGNVYGLDMHLIADQTRLKSAGYHKSWFAHKDRAGGGHLMWLGLHWLDLSMYITDSNIEQVVGFVANVGGQPIDIEDSAAMTMRYDNGTLGTMTSGYYLDRGYNSLIKIWGSEGWLQIDRTSPHKLSWYSSKKMKSGEVERFVGPSDHSAYSTFVRAAVRASADMQKPPITSDESLRILRTVFGMYRAAETGEAQEVK